MADTMRSLNSFGVAGLLNIRAEVLYSNEMRARSVGRVSDLVAAKLREKEADELRIRATLAYGVFLAYGLKGLEPRHSEDVEPVAAELGIDENFVAIGISLHWDKDRTPLFQGLADRVSRRAGANPFEKTLEWLVEHGSQVIVRYEMKERRLEVVTLCHRRDARAKDPMQVVSVDSATAPLLEVASYVELGDLDYTKLLRAPTIADAMDAEETKGEAQTVVKGGIAGPAEEEFRAHGTAEPAGEEVQVVAASLGDAEAEEFRFAADAPAVADEATRAVIEEYERTIGELRDTVQALELKLEAAAGRRGGGATPSRGAEAEEERRFSSAPVVVDDAVTVVKGSDGEEPVQQSAETILGALQSMASESRSKKIDETFREIETAVDEKRSRKWLETLTTELIQEKGRLGELQKALARQFTKRELEFKSSEALMAQELKRKDDLIRQKDLQIEQKLEQLAQANVTIERLNGRGSDKEAQQLRAKLDRTQRIAQMKEEEAKSLGMKVRDLENRLIISQSRNQNGADAQAVAKIQTLERKLDEYKRINARLMETLNNQRDSGSDKESIDLRRKADQLDRAFSDAKRALERANFKIRELQENEKRLQTENARALEENRNLRKSLGRGTGESGSGSSSGSGPGDQAA